MIRVLHMIASLEIGGSQSFVMNIYRNINRNQIQFDFIVDHAEQMCLADEIERLGGRVYVLPTFRLVNISEIRKAWNDFFSEHPEYRILHSHSRSYASVYLPIAKKHGITTIVHSHSTSNGGGAKAVLKNMMQYPIRFQADYFMACSKGAGEWLFGKRIIKKSNFFIIKNAIDASKFIYSKEKRMEIRRELGLNRDDFVLGALGRVVAAKNPSFILEVFKQIKTIRKGSRLLFVGDGALLEDMKAYANALGIFEDIIFTGTRIDTDRLLCAMDCYIFPSLWEGLGISLVEAQASGLKCVCSERIPKEAIFTELVKVMQLSDGSEAWGNYIADMGEYSRTYRNDTVTEVGYDIKENAELLESFYILIDKENRMKSLGVY